MMKKKWIKGLLVLSLIFLVLAVGSLRLLTLSSKTDLLWYKIIKDGDTFEIEQSHSLSLTKTTDRFLIKSGHVYHTAIVSQDQGGAGLPDVLLNKEQLSFNAQGEFVFSSNKLITLPIRCINDKEYDWKLYYKNETYETTEKYLIITSKKTSYLQLIWIEIRGLYEISMDRL